ncbi:cation-transporting P-type ATPase [Patescibacteria group bacterium]|nr:cation-transporting P-type ATPase [Patescibacteria group bacterium]
MQYYAKSIKEDLADLKTDPDKGLQGEEVIKRQQELGPNALDEKKPDSYFIVLLRQFKDLFTVILFVAAGVSFLFGEKVDAVIILAALVLNITISVIQETKAIKTISELKEIIVYKAKVIRDGNVKEVDAKKLVPGDIIHLDAGDRVPADARLIKTTSFETKEAVLTGEANSIKKDESKTLKEDITLGDRLNMVFQGTVVTNGKAKAVVTAIGMQTEMGQIAKLVSEAKEEATPLQKKMKELSIWISIAAGVAILLVFVTGVLLGHSMLEMFEFAVALAIGSIPEGMVLSVTIILAVGMRQILKKKAIVRELVAAETLGSTTVICSDKTGTITTGEMVAEKIVTPDGEFLISKLQKDQIEKDQNLQYSMLVSALNNDLIVEDPEKGCKRVIGDTTEKALFDMALRAGYNKCSLVDDYPLIDEIPFDSYIKYMVSAHNNKENGKTIVFVKGTAERLLDLSVKIFKDGECREITAEDKKRVLKQNDSLSLKGYRVITLGYKEVDNEGFDIQKDRGQDITFLSFVAIRDPIRKNIRESLDQCRKAGVEVKMITGDHKMTAKNIATEVGFVIKSDDEIIDGTEFEALSEEELAERVPKVKIFARVAPIHKLKIVEVLEKKGEVVAMTGDGVNDGPALKKADIGIAMGSGTEVAQQTASMVLLDDNFKTIVASVKEGRRIFDNIRKVVLFLLSDSFSELLLIFGSLLLGLPVPLLPAQILWINIIDDGLPNVALAFDPAEKEIMNEPPRKKQEPVLNAEMKVLMTIIGLVTGLGTLLMFYVLLKVVGKPVEEARTVCFAFLAVDTLLYVFSIRSLRHTIFHERFFSNLYLLGAVAAGFILQIAAIYFAPLQKIFRTVPLSWQDWGIIFAAALVLIVIIEIVKWIFLVRRKKHE